ncbi:MAG: hypothetical protein ACRD5E_04850 [Nitrososphaeraceae archaeon]
MNRIFLIALTLALSLGLMTIVSTGISPSYGQQNQSSNTTSTQQNQTTEIGSAGEIENMTAGNIPVLGNETDIESQNDTSITEGLQKEQLTTDTNTTNNQTESEGNQTQRGPLEQIGEAISGIFGGGNQSN